MAADHRVIFHAVVTVICTLNRAKQRSGVRVAQKAGKCHNYPVNAMSVGKCRKREATDSWHFNATAQPKVVMSEGLEPPAVCRVNVPTLTTTPDATLS